MYFLPGTQSVTTTDLALGVAGRPTRVYSVSLISDTTAGTLKLRNGTTTGGTLYIQVDGVISKGATFDSTEGVLFPSGCFMDADAHTVSGYVSFEQEL